MTRNTTPPVPFPALLADIGGTNARFQLVDADGPRGDVCELVVAEHESLEAATQLVMPKDVTIKSAVLAGAGPLKPTGRQLTNSHWDIVAETFMDRTSIDNLILFNDFEAQALALPFLKPEDFHELNPQAIENERATKAVLGPGTGLGVGLLVRSGAGFTTVAGEGGHVDLGPRNEREAAIWQHLDRIDGRISGEQVLCGRGMANLYRATCVADGVTPALEKPADISEAGLDGSDPQAVETLHIFAACLGRIAGDLALTSFSKGGAYIGGGIARRLLPIIDEGGLLEAFLDKAPHRALLETMKLAVVTCPQPALLGLSGYARAAAPFAVDLEGRHWKR
ncbi:glucokinase [Ahrensia sp. R2A130]|uniref:glucokinase n=1 Tax=Ahrensia sp. R2A130 TaxID=744979 RepID=UPI0001E0E8AA|nr:glucokinase [Ahrensia sp. R2A130]EFL89139.1 glucokinase [Ahrensia sp. R2A130]